MGAALNKGLKLLLEILVRLSPSSSLHSATSLPQKCRSLLTAASPLSPVMDGSDVEDASTPTTPHRVSSQLVLSSLGLPTSIMAASTPVISFAFPLPPPLPLSSVLVGSLVSVSVLASVLSSVFSHWVSGVPIVPSTHHGLLSTAAPFAAPFLVPSPLPVSALDPAIIGEVWHALQKRMTSAKCTKSGFRLSGGGRGRGAGHEQARVVVAAHIASSFAIASAQAATSAQAEENPSAQQTTSVQSGPVSIPGLTNEQVQRLMSLIELPKNGYETLSCELPWMIDSDASKCKTDEEGCASRPQPLEQSDGLEGRGSPAAPQPNSASSLVQVPLAQDVSMNSEAGRDPQANAEPKRAQRSRKPPAHLDSYFQILISMVEVGFKILKLGRAIQINSEDINTNLRIWILLLTNEAINLAAMVD
ncbi:hypothetical protein Cgig2_008550 [Carnegiea gigantea]|uniref:Uncharacterized protein n=1 Tax=Carnegiea gigantea TaxID=171969 RepID=A0A9Q1GM70_9CARY|nr:hypothetical protein Cgig2_008550 [Carnegiea gigantea]